MTIDSYLSELKKFYQLKYNQTLEKHGEKNKEYAEFWAQKETETKIYNTLCGDRNKELRQKIAEKITGEKTPFYKSAVHDLQKMIIQNMKDAL